MHGIDQYAYNSPWLNIHPGEKLALALGTMVMVLGLQSLWVSVLVLLGMSLLIVGSARIPVRFYLELMLVPMVFLSAGCAAVVLTTAHTADSLWKGWFVAGQWWGISQASLAYAGALLLRSLACVSCLYLLALTTPVTQLVFILRRLRLPAVIADLMGLIYINVFMFLQTAQDIRIAQQSRGGYQNLTGQMRNLSVLAGNIFIKNLERSNASYNALLARGYDGQLQVLEEAYVVSPLRITCMGGIAAGFITILLWGGL